MPSVYSSILSFASVLSVVHGHAALIAVQGIEGSPQGIGFKGKLISRKDEALLPVLNSS